jgi:Putative zinc finger in N-recognin (UBR box)
MEDLNLTAPQQQAYDSVRRILAAPPGDFLETSPIPSLVKLEWTPPSTAATTTTPTNASASGGAAAASAAGTPAAAGTARPLPALVVARAAISPGVDADDEDTEVVTIVTPSRGHHEMYRKLEELEGLEKEESTLLERSDATVTLSSVVTGQPFYEGPQQAVQHLYRLGQAVPRRVCQHPFRKNDIVWVCKTCQADETCVLCHACFSQSNHEGHDVAFYHAQAGGCCDCGDPDGASFLVVSSEPSRLLLLCVR